MFFISISAWTRVMRYQRKMFGLFTGSYTIPPPSSSDLHQFLSQVIFWFDEFLSICVSQISKKNNWIRIRYSFYSTRGITIYILLCIRFPFWRMALLLFCYYKLIMLWPEWIFWEMNVPSLAFLKVIIYQCNQNIWERKHKHTSSLPATPHVKTSILVKIALKSPKKSAAWKSSLLFLDKDYCRITMQQFCKYSMFKIWWKS